MDFSSTKWRTETFPCKEWLIWDFRQNILEQRPFDTKMRTKTIEICMWMLLDLGKMDQQLESHIGPGYKWDYNIA